MIRLIPMTQITQTKLPELIVSAAVQITFSSSMYIVPCTGYDTPNLNSILKVLQEKENQKGKLVQGFVTNRNRFLNQEAALPIAMKHRQIRRFCSIKDPHLLSPEDLY